MDKYNYITTKSEVHDALGDITVEIQEDPYTANQNGWYSEEIQFLVDLLEMLGG